MPWNKGDTLRFSSLPLKIDGAAKVQPRGEFGAVNRMNKSAMPVKGESIPQVSSGEREHSSLGLLDLQGQHSSGFSFCFYS